MTTTITPITPATIARLRELTGWRGNSDDDGEHEEDLDLADWQIRAIYSALQSGAIPIPDDAPQLAAQAAEIERWRSDWKRIAADEAVWYTLSDIFGVEGMTNAAGVVSGVTEKWNERQTRVAELEDALGDALPFLRSEAALWMDGRWESVRDVANRIDAVLAKREGGR